MAPADPVGLAVASPSIAPPTVISGVLFASFVTAQSRSPAAGLTSFGGDWGGAASPPGRGTCVLCGADVASRTEIRAGSPVDWARTMASCRRVTAARPSSKTT